jgi:hypothetical protein
MTAEEGEKKITSRMIKDIEPQNRGASSLSPLLAAGREVTGRGIHLFLPFYSQQDRSI